MSASVNVGALIATLGVDILDFEAKLKRAKEDLDKALEGIKKTSLSIEKMGEDFTKAGQKMASAGKKMSAAITLPLIAMGTAMVKLEMEFEAQMTKITSLIGVSETQVKAWRGEVLKMSQSTGKGPQELAEALYFVSSAGFRGVEAMQILENSAKAAAAGMGETKMIADNVTSALNAFKSTGLDAAKATDILINAVRLGKVEAQDLVVSLGHVFPIASKLGVAYHEVGAAVAAMTRTGTPAETAAVQLRQAISQLINPSKQARVALNDMNWSAEEFRKEMQDKGLFHALETFSTKVEQFGDIEIAAKVFGNIRALTGVFDLMGDNVEENRKIFEEMANTMDRTNFAFETVSMTLKQKWNIAVSHGQVAMITFGETLKEMVIPILMDLTNWVHDLSDRWNNLTREQKQNIVTWLGIVAAVGPVLVVVGKLVAIIGTTITGFIKLRTAVIALNVASWANPYVLLAAALVAVGAGLYYLIKKTDTFTTVQGRANTLVKDFKKGLVQQTVAIENSFDKLTALTQATNLSNIQQEERKRLIQDINSKYAEYLPFLLTEKSTIQDIAEAQAVATEALRNDYKEKQKQVVLGKIEEKLAKKQEEAYDKVQLYLDKKGLSYKQQAEIQKRVMAGEVSAVESYLSTIKGHWKGAVYDIIQQTKDVEFALKEATETSKHFLSNLNQIDISDNFSLGDISPFFKGVEFLDAAKKAMAAFLKEIADGKAELEALEKLPTTFNMLFTAIDNMKGKIMDMLANKEIIPQAMIDEMRSKLAEMAGIEATYDRLFGDPKKGSGGSKDTNKYFPDFKADFEKAMAALGADAETFPRIGIDIAVDEEKYKIIQNLLGALNDPKYVMSAEELAEAYQMLYDVFDGLQLPATGMAKIMEDFNEQMRIGAEEAKIFGLDNLAILKQQLANTEAAIRSAIAAKEKDSIAMEKLIADYNKYKLAIKEAEDALKEHIQVGKMLGNMFAGMVADTISALVTPLEEGEKMADRMLSIVGDYLVQLGTALIAAAIAVQEFKDLVSKNPYLAVAAGMAAIALGAHFKSIANAGPGGNVGYTKVPAFADGGIVYGPTIAQVGEYAGAKSNPEVIAPLSDLKNLLADNDNGSGEVEFFIKGDVIAGILKKHNKRVKSYK